MPDSQEQLRDALADRYRIDREIGRGGMATVYIAKDLRHDRDVALKVLHPEVSLALGRERFLREIKLTAKLSHPNILTVHDSGESAGCLWYAMPFVDGETLRHKIGKEGRLPIDEAMRLAFEAAEAIGYAHSLGIVHRDIKPENILLSQGHAIIADFGIARAIDVARDDHLTSSGVSLGTPAYMSPEQALGEVVDATTDVWALGCVMFEMLAGRAPFGDGRESLARSLIGTAEPLRSLRPDVPESVERTVATALSRDKSARFANGAQLAEAIKTNGSAQVKYSRQSRPYVLIGATAAVVVALVVFGARALKPASNPRAAPGRMQMSRDSLARAFYERGKTEVAHRTPVGLKQGIAFYSQAIARDSSFAMAWADLARTANFAYTRGSDLGIPLDSLRSLALRATDKAAALAPNDPVVWLLKARSAFMMDPTNDGPRLFGVKKALSLDSTYAPAWFELGLIREELLEPDAALSAYKHAASLNPSDPQTLSFIALHYLWSGDYKTGMQWADSAVNLEPTYALARSTSGQLEFELGNFAEAGRHHEAEARLTTGAEQGNAYVLYARALGALGRKDEARTKLDMAMKALDPVHAKHEAAFLGTTLASLHDTVEAVRVLKSYIPREDVHYQLHLKRDPGLRWIKGSRWESELLAPDPRKVQ